MTVRFRINYGPTVPIVLIVGRGTALYTPGKRIVVEARSDAVAGARGYVFVWYIDNQKVRQETSAAPIDILEIPNGFDYDNHALEVEIYAGGVTGPPDIGNVDFSGPTKAQAAVQREIESAEMYPPGYKISKIGRGRSTFELGGTSQLPGGFVRKSLGFRAGERVGQQNLPRVTMAVNKGKYELNKAARLYAAQLYEEYKEELNVAKQELENARDDYFTKKRDVLRRIGRSTRFFKYTVRRGFKMPLGLGGGNEILEDVVEKSLGKTDRDDLRQTFQRFAKAEATLNKFLLTKMGELSKSIEEKLKPAAEQIAARQIYKYKIGKDFLEAQEHIKKSLQEEATELAQQYAKTGRAKLRGFAGVMTRLSMKSNTLRNIWYTMLYNIWDFIWGPMILGLIMTFVVMAGFISFFIIPTYVLNASLFLYIIPLAGAAINWVMNFESNKYALDHLDSMVSGALIAQGITIFLFALIGQPGLYLDTLYYYMLFAFLFIFFGIFQFYQTGGFPIVLKMSVIVLIFGWVALGPYKAMYEGAINQVRTPVLVAWRAGTNAVSDISLLVTNPTAWYAKQQTTNVRPERPMAIPRALEITSINLLPQAVPQGAEFAMFLVVKNDGDLPARNVAIIDENGVENVKCNSYCEFTNGKTAQITPLDKRNGEAYLMPGEAGRIEIRGLKAKYEENRRAESRLGIVYINLSYEYSTNSSLLVSVMSKNEFQRRFAEKEDVFRQIVAMGKVSPAQLSLNVGPQPLESGKRALLLVSVSNARDDGRIFLRQLKDAIIIRMQKVIGSGLECGAGGMKLQNPGTVSIGAKLINVDFDPSREEALVYVMQSNQEIRQYAFSSIFSILCSFQSTPDSNLATTGVQTGLITAELPTYEFRIIKEQSVPITGFIGIVANPSDDTCGKCGTGAFTLCTRSTCHGIMPQQGQCWLDTSERFPGAGVIADQGTCRACAEKQCSSFTKEYDCTTEAKNRCGRDCNWENIPSITFGGRCVAKTTTPGGTPVDPNYCANLMLRTTERRQCIIGEGACKDTSECRSYPKESIGGFEGIGLECRDPGIGTKVCCPEKDRLGNYADELCRMEYEKVKSKLVAPITATGEIPDRIRQMASSMKPVDADGQIRQEGIANSFEELVLKLAKRESSLKQCNDGTLKCSNNNNDFTNVVCSTCKSPGGCKGNAQTIPFGGKLSCGVMQISLKDHNPQSYRCSSFAEIGCNIETGITILIRNYNSFKNGISEPELQKHCTDEPFKSQYLQYRGWKAALRAYNGWGCSTGADTSFVENVIKQSVS